MHFNCHVINDSGDLVGEKVMEIAEDARADLAAQAREEQA